MCPTALLLSGYAGLEAHPACSMDTGDKVAEREADHSPQCAGVKSEWSYASTSPYVFMACKRNSFTFVSCETHCDMGSICRYPYLTNMPYSAV